MSPLLQRKGRRIPDYSPCCENHVLPRDGELYCHGCGETLVKFTDATMRELRWEQIWPEQISLLWRNLQVAYARDNGEDSFKWVSAFSIATSAMGLDEPLRVDNFPGRFGFDSLVVAARDLARTLRRIDSRVPLLKISLKVASNGRNND